MRNVPTQPHLTDELKKGKTNNPTQVKQVEFD